MRVIRPITKKGRALYIRLYIYVILACLI